MVRSRINRNRNRNRNSNRNRNRNSNRNRKRNRNRNRSRNRRRNRNNNQKGGSGFAAILKEAVVPIAFLGANVKLKKGKFGNKTVMIPIFKDMNKAKLDRDRGRTRRIKYRGRRGKSRRKRR